MNNLVRLELSPSRFSMHGFVLLKYRLLSTSYMGHSQRMSRTVSRTSSQCGQSLSAWPDMRWLWVRWVWPMRKRQRTTSSLRFLGKQLFHCLVVFLIFLSLLVSGLIFRQLLSNLALIFCLSAVLKSVCTIARHTMYSFVVATLASSSAFSLPSSPTWLGIQQKLICFPFCFSFIM